ncbi:membrane protein [Acrocarpospora phusangensis]|uniref:Membrane protein n=1 Tax=Acrocarpospora phusangensis TaxID=1070424 RepID=A0A919QCG9_9ACTN|nr:hypothetical protein [Acrocarpospora phusangensis]GIH24085.1 membrane protein [Acrocarpospora phusangensis]
MSWFTREIVEAGKLRLFCFFVAFILAFLFIRFSVRMIRAQVSWWPGNITPGGTHIHHVVFGLVLMCLGGISGLAVTDSRSWTAAALAMVFGVGTALVLDEFALVLRLEDVYWAEEGRLSVDAVFVAAALCGLALLGVSPFEISDAFTEEQNGDLLSHGEVVLLVAVNVLFAALTLLKGKVWTGLLGIYLTPLALIGAVRLARPGSPWARWRYLRKPRKLARAHRRERHLREPAARLMRALQDFLAGRPSM